MPILLKVLVLSLLVFVSPAYSKSVTAADKKDPDAFVDSANKTTLGALEANESPNILWSAGPEIGISAISVGQVDSKNAFSAQLDSWGWSNITESKIKPSTSISYGCFVKAERKNWLASVGYRSNELGASSAYARGTGSGANSISIFEEVKGSYQQVYLRLGWSHESVHPGWFGRKKKKKYSINLENGFGWLAFTDNLSVSGYNGAPINAKINTGGTSSNYIGSIQGGIERTYFDHLVFGVNLGYQLFFLPNLTYTQVDSNTNLLNVPKVGDVMKNSDGTSSVMNLCGPLANLKISWVF